MDEDVDELDAVNSEIRPDIFNRARNYYNIASVHRIVTFNHFCRQATIPAVSTLQLK